MFFPIQLDKYGEGDAAVLKSILMSINRAMRSFALTDIDFINPTHSINPSAYNFYSLFLMVICFVCPFLSLGYILSLFSKVRASTKLALSYGKDIYVFSQLNEESITFASDISQNHPKAGIIFCDVIDSSGGESNPFSDRAEQLNATCLNKPITAVNFKLHSKSAAFTSSVSATTNRQIPTTRSS